MSDTIKDWAFIPTKEELEDLNKLRARYYMTEVSDVKLASEWFEACEEIDRLVELETTKKINNS